MLAVVIVAVIAWFWILPAAFFAVDLLVVLAIALWGLILRMAFGRPWRVVASQAGSSPSEEYVFLVRGFRASRRARDEIVVQIAAGQTPSRAEPA